MAFNVPWFISQDDDIRKNPNLTENAESSSNKSELETVKKYAAEIDETIIIHVRKSATHKKGNMIAVLCRDDEEETDYYFFDKTKEDAIKKAFNFATESYLGE